MPDAARISEGVPAGDVFRKGTRLYKVLWQGWSEDEATWEPKPNLPGELVAAFESEREPAPSQVCASALRGHLTIS